MNIINELKSILFTLFKSNYRLYKSYSIEREGRIEIITQESDDWHDMKDIESHIRESYYNDKIRTLTDEFEKGYEDSDYCIDGQTKSFYGYLKWMFGDVYKGSSVRVTFKCGWTYKNSGYEIHNYNYIDDGVFTNKNFCKIMEEKWIKKNHDKYCRICNSKK